MTTREISLKTGDRYGLFSFSIWMPLLIVIFEMLANRVELKLG